MTEIMNAPNADIYVVDVSFKALQDKSERDYLNQLPTSFTLPGQAVDRLRAAARTLILNSPDLQQALRDEWRPDREQPVMGMTAPVTTPPTAAEAK
jgi:NTE family protein